MFELLVIVIGVLVVAGVVAVVRSRRSEGDPAGSVQAFNRALSAMEPAAHGSPPARGEVAPEGDEDGDDPVEDEPGRRSG